MVRSTGTIGAQEIQSNIHLHSFKVPNYLQIDHYLVHTDNSSLTAQFSV